MSNPNIAVWFNNWNPPAVSTCFAAAPTYMRNATAYGSSTRLRADIVVNNLGGSHPRPFLDTSPRFLEEALSPPVDERGYAAFLYEELTWPHVTAQFGARLNHASYEPERDRLARWTQRR